MALQAFLTTTSSVNVIGNLGTVDDAVVGAQVTLVSSVAVISGTGSTHSVNVLGSIFGAGGGVALGSTGKFGNIVTVASTGQITSDSASIFLMGTTGFVNNSGFIGSISRGIYMTGDDADSSFSVTNYGTINANTAIEARGSGTFHIKNYGHIEALNQSLSAEDTADVRLTNHGTIIGTLSFGDLRDTVVSFGRIDGDLRMGGGNDSVMLRGEYAAPEGFNGHVMLEAGNDEYNGRWAKAQEITIYGGDGDDGFVPGDALEYFDAGEGFDSISLFAAKQAVTVTLGTDQEIFGNAGSDALYSVERVYGSRFGDRLTGSYAANSLEGNLGNDTLNGGLGEDTLHGSSGLDRLTGGGGNDAFMFYTTTSQTDTVTDFSNVAGNNDAIHIYADGFGGGLVAGPLAPSQFRSRPDNVAQDADDRFIFEIPTKSLWFDVDGNGTAAAIKIVDLQDSATFSLADLVLI